MKGENYSKPTNCFDDGVCVCLCGGKANRSNYELRDGFKCNFNNRWYTHPISPSFSWWSIACLSSLTSDSPNRLSHPNNGLWTNAHPSPVHKSSKDHFFGFGLSAPARPYMSREEQLCCPARLAGGNHLIWIIRMLLRIHGVWGWRVPVSSSV